MIHLLYGTEEYCIWFKKCKLLETISMPEMNVVEFDEFDSETVTFLNTFPLLSEKKAGVVRVKDIKALNNDDFLNYLGNPMEFSELILLPQKVDKRTSFYKKLKESGVQISENNKLDTMEALKKMVGVFLKPFHEVKISNSACEMLIQRLNYVNQPTVNLFTLKNTVENLAQCSSVINDELVKELVEDNEKDNAFVLSNLLQNKDISALKKQEDAIIRAQGTSIPALSALLREYRIAYKKAVLKCSAKELGVPYVSINTDDTGYLARCIYVITSVIAEIKRGKIQDSKAISFAVYRIMDGM